MSVADISGILAQFGNLVKMVADILRICLRLRLGRVCRGHSEMSQKERVVPKRVEVTDISVGPTSYLPSYLAKRSQRELNDFLPSLIHNMLVVRFIFLMCDTDRVTDWLLQTTRTRVVFYFV